MFLLIIAFRLNARDPLFKPTTHIGIHGGLTLSTVAFSPYEKQSFLPSEYYGLVFRHVSEPNIGLQIEINSTGTGWKELVDSVGSYTRRLETINIPVTAAFIAGKRTMRFAFTVGSYVSYLRHNEEFIDMPVNPKIKKHYFQPLVSRWEFGFIAGASAEVHTKIGAFAVRASYSHALTNLFPLNQKTIYKSASRQQIIHAGVMYFYTF